MTPHAVDRLKHFAFVLRNADPESYQAFLSAFEVYATEITVAVTDAPAEAILNLQGRAKQTLVLFDVLRNPKPLAASQQP